MSRKNKILLAVVIILLLALIGVIIWNRLSQKQEEPVAVPVTEQPVVKTDAEILDDSMPKPSDDYIDSGTTVLPAESVVSEPVNDMSALKAIALSFTERFGSYSNQSDFENIRELMVFMTPEMKKWADDFIAESRQTQTPGAPYYGITTQALSTELGELDEQTNTIEITVNTQRIEYKGALKESRIFYHNLKLSMKKTAGVWFIDSVKWE